MPWSPERYPPSMRGLPSGVRWKAIEIANALLEEGRDEGQAIRMAIAAAKKWALRTRRSGPACADGDASPSARSR